MRYILMVACLLIFVNSYAQKIDSLEGYIAAKHNHRILYENDSIRVLEVILLPGESEAPHIHSLPCLFILTHFAKCEYYRLNQGRDTVHFVMDNPLKYYVDSTSYFTRKISPESLHYTKNIDTTTFKAIRIEFKRR